MHSTGAEKRLARKTLSKMVPFGSKSYAQEELVAEMGSAYLYHLTIILPNQIQNIISYLDDWLGVFKKDKRFVISAAWLAQRAVDFILNRQAEESKDEVNESAIETVVS